MAKTRSAESTPSQQELEPIVDAMQSGNDDEAANLFSSLHDIYNYRTLNPQVEIHAGDQSLSCSLLFLAAKHNCLKTAIKILNCYPDVDYGISAVNGSTFHGKSPLIAACEEDHLQMIEILLSFRASTARFSADNKTPINSVKSVAAAKLIVEYTQTQNYSFYLFLGGFGPENYFEIACSSNRPEVALYFCEQTFDNIFDHIDARRALHYARTMSWSYPENYLQFEEVCRAIKMRATLPTPTNVYPKSISRFSAFKESSQQLFGGKFNDDRLTSSQWKKYPLMDFLKTTIRKSITTIANPEETKKLKIKTVLAEFYALLMNPKECVKYLKFINKEFVRYCLETHNKTFSLDRRSIYFQKINDVFYPIPDEQYVGLNKHSALQAFLISFLRSHGLAEKSYKWIGFVSRNIADKIILDGHFVTEDRFDLGLFHGKLSHMIQIVILILAIQNKEIDLNGLSIKDIIEALINDRKWTTILDSRLFTGMQFSDPHRLSEFIMHQGPQYGFTELSDYCVDSFCKGFKRLLDASYATIPQHRVDLDTFARKLNDLNLEFFLNNTAGVSHSIARERKKPGMSFFSVDRNHAVVEKKYSINNNFTPSRFS